jgi:hypothetical protein
MNNYPFSRLQFGHNGVCHLPDKLFFPLRVTRRAAAVKVLQTPALTQREGRGVVGRPSPLKTNDMAKTKGGEVMPWRSRRWIRHAR